MLATQSRKSMVTLAIRSGKTTVLEDHRLLLIHMGSTIDRLDSSMLSLNRIGTEN
jgi:hypothetical protein